MVAVKRAKIGLMIALSTPKINATINRVMIWLVCSSRSG